MQAKEIIAKKREGLENSSEELTFLLNGFLRGEIKEYQLSAWLMAVFFQGMTERELSRWTELMWKSGDTLQRLGTQSRESSSFWIDKHSTGGVGDKTSLILVPLVTTAAKKYLKGVQVGIPMVSGRGLGHTGGTLDKLESVPGFNSQVSLPQATELMNTQGFFMAGQTDSIAPADRLIYSLRDVTGTIESIPLIISSIMSKKLAENLNGIVFDVKTGLGAFMPSREQAVLLAKGLVSVARHQGLDAISLITQMDEPLGWKTGNFLEVEECADFLNKGPREKKLEELVIESAAWMLFLASHKKITLSSAKDMCREILESGTAFSTFPQLFESQGGNFREFEKEREDFRKKYLVYDHCVSEAGFVSMIHAREIGVLLVELGGGRVVKESKIDNKVGFEFLKKVGEPIKSDEVLVRVYHRHSDEVPKIQSVLKKAIHVCRNQTELGIQSAIVGEVIE